MHFRENQSRRRERVCLTNSESVSRMVTEAFSNAALKALLEFGPSVRTAVLYHMEQMQGQPADEILHDPICFVSSLKAIFSSGAKVIEEKIVKSMCAELKVECPAAGDDTFEERYARIQSVKARDAPPKLFYLSALEQTMR